MLETADGVLAQTQAAETKPMRAVLPHILLGLFALQPLPLLLSHDAVGYAGLWLATASLAFLLWRTRSAAGPTAARSAVVAVGFLFLLGQFARAEGVMGGAQLWVSAALVAGALVDVSQCVGIRRTWHGWDWLAVALAMALVGACLVGSPLAFGSAIAWGGGLRTGLALALWFAVTRAAPLAPTATRHLTRLLMFVLLVGALVGAGRLAALYGYLDRGMASRRAGDLAVAIHRLQRAAQLGAGLGLDGIRSRIELRLAGAYASRGDDGGAARVLGLEPGYIARVDAEAWDGTEGGNLDYQTSCWSDLMWYPGQAQIRVFASGEPDYGIWPRMRVQVGDQMVGEEWVDAHETVPYEFGVRISEVGKQRLTVTLINDATDPERDIQRSLRVAQAEVQYRWIAWE